MDGKNNISLPNIWENTPDNAAGIDKLIAMLFS